MLVLLAVPGVWMVVPEDRMRRRALENYGKPAYAKWASSSLKAHLNPRVAPKLYLTRVFSTVLKPFICQPNKAFRTPICALSRLILNADCRLILVIRHSSQEVTDNRNHVCAAMVNGKPHIDANENQETVVHIVVPVETFRDVVNRLEEVSPGI